MPSYKLLRRFEDTFVNGPYRHRDANLGNRIADFLYEDLFDLAPTSKLRRRVLANTHALNPKNVSPGIRARRGDGSFGDVVPGTLPVLAPGFSVVRAPTADVEIGAEVKIVAKAMMKQIDRVVSDMRRQAEHFKTKSPDAITVGLVGINWAEAYTSYEGDRSYPTDGRKYPHPVQEAAEAEKRLLVDAAPALSEFAILRFRATNVEPYPFEWVSRAQTEADYGSRLVRILKAYERRF
jgi:hypothetical protein